MTTMNFHGDLAQLELGGNLLIRPTGGNAGHDFSFAWRQGLKTFLQFCANGYVLSPGTVLTNSQHDCIEQFLVPEWLCQELDGSGFEGPRRHRDVAVAGDENNRKMNPRSCEVALEIESASPRQSDIEHDACGGVGPLAIEKFLRRPEQLYFERHRAKKTVQRVSDGRIVIDHEYDRLFLTHETSPDVYGEYGDSRGQPSIFRVIGRKVSILAALIHLHAFTATVAASRRGSLSRTVGSVN
jgi:hypothetical protein